MGAGNALRVPRTCPNLPEKLLYDQRSPYTFSIAVGTLDFPLSCCCRFENWKFGTWNLFLNPTEKSTLGCVRTFSAASWLRIVSICLTVMRFGVTFTVQLLLSAKSPTPNWDRPEAASFSEDMHAIYVACIVLFILYYDSGMSHITLFVQLHIYATFVWQNFLSKHRS